MWEGHGKNLVSFATGGKPQYDLTSLSVFSCFDIRMNTSGG